MTTPHEETLDRLRQRLHYLELQKATFGLHTPPHVAIEIEDTRNEIARLTEQMQSVPSALSSLTQHAAASNPEPLSIPEVFISYSRKNSNAITELAQQLRARGLRVWRDLDNLALGHPAEETIHTAIAHHIDAAILYLTPDSLRSRFIRAVELPAIVARYQQHSTPRFPIIPIFDGVTFDEADDATLASGKKLSDFNGVVIPDEADAATRSASMAEAAQRTLESILTPYLRRLPPNQAVEIELFSHPEASFGEPALIHMDWRKRFETLPPPAVWHTVLLPALHDIRRVLGANRIRHIRLRPKAHLSVGFAFGYVFRETTDFTLEVEQRQQWWRSDDAPIQGTPLRVTSTPVDETGHDTSIECSISPTLDVREAVERSIRRHGLSIRNRIHFSFPAGVRSVQDGAHAMAMAHQIRKKIGEIRNQRGNQTIHLFGAMPLGLAVLLGARLNACEPIQCYEYNRATNEYEPSCRLA